MKNKEIISEIRNDLRALNIDDKISARYILAKLRGFLALYLKRENDQFRLHNLDGVWTTVECVPMVPSNNVECCGIVIPKCKLWMKSKTDIPDSYTSKYGPLLKNVTSMRGDIEFHKTTPQDYAKMLNRRYLDRSKKYYWIENKRIVIPDTEVEYINFDIGAKEHGKALKMSECNPGGCSPDNKCWEPLEEEFPCPAYLEAQVKSDTIANLYNFYKRTVVDEMPNLDVNQKTERPRK